MIINFRLINQSSGLCYGRGSTSSSTRNGESLALRIRGDVSVNLGDEVLGFPVDAGLGHGPVPPLVVVAGPHAPRAPRFALRRAIVILHSRPILLQLEQAKHRKRRRRRALLLPSVVVVVVVIVVIIIASHD